MSFLNFFKRPTTRVNPPTNPMSLSELWACFFYFSPWRPSSHTVIVLKVAISIAEAHPKYGILIETKEPDLTGYQTYLKGFLGQFLYPKYNCAFFYSEADARTAYDNLMREWMSRIASTMSSPTPSASSPETTLTPETDPDL